MLRERKKPQKDLDFPKEEEFTPPHKIFFKEELRVGANLGFNPLKTLS